MYTNNRADYRHVFFTTWKKHLQKLPLEAVEAQLLQVILQHPEYHTFLDQDRAFAKQEFALEENPFFHMSLHQAIQEQISVNRPSGIREIEQQLLIKHGDSHRVAHEMMQCLYAMMYQAQQTGQMPPDKDYLEQLRNAL